MSIARCTSCHCYSRNCPEGLPNHRNALVGPNCLMNQQGRHYRDQTDTAAPMCDYAGCTFFASDALSGTEYPSDVSLGPAPAVAEAQPPPASQSSDMSEIMSLLLDQKAENDRRNKQVLELQKTVNSLLSASLPAQAVSSPAQATSSPTLSQHSPPTYSTPLTTPSTVHHSVPASVANAANILQNNFARQFGGIQGQDGSNPLAGLMLGAGLRNEIPAPASNPLSGMGAALGYRNDSPAQVISSVDQLYAATVKCKQLKAFEFAATQSQFPYKSSLNQNNINAVAFAYGSFKHLEAIMTGLIPGVSETELIARVRHLKNVYEVCCLSSNLSTFAEPSWQVAREYDARIMSDIESGGKTWEGLSNGLETDAIYVAKEICELKNKKRAKTEKTDKVDVKSDKSKKDPKSNGCTTYNTHRASDGCYWEHLNKGEKCVYDHFCSWCKTNRNLVEQHKSLTCEFKTDQ